MTINPRDIPAVPLDLAPWCGCPKGDESWQRITRKFVRPSPDLLDSTGFDFAAIVDLDDWPDFATYQAAVKRTHKGRALRHARKSDRAGYYCKPFPWRRHVPDAHEINTSKEIRCGKPMRPGYLTPIDKMGGYPNDRTPTEFVPGPCPLHHFIPWGVFQPVKPYFQGTVQTDEQLLAYIKFKRIGEMALYTQILGHGDYLADGIMYRLHLAIMEWMLDPARDHREITDGIRYIVYAQYFCGNRGLRQWKKKLLFQPARLYQDPKRIGGAEDAA